MPPFPAITRITAHLLPAGPPPAVQPGRRHRFRLLVVGPAVLVRSEPGPWRVSITGGDAVRPVASRLRAAAVGPRSTIRVAAALLDPIDLATDGHRLLTSLHLRRPVTTASEFYGWSLLYRLPGDRDTARVDPHDDFLELPAFYESPLELADRQEFLRQRGISTRVLALLTNRTDFDIAADQQPRNRYYDHAQWRRAGAAALFGG